MMRTSTGSFIPIPSVVPGARVTRANPESRDSGFDAFASPRNNETTILVHNPYRQRANAADEVRIKPLRWARDFEAKVALQDFLPQNSQLLFGEPVADTTMDAGAERKMLPRLCT